MSKDYAYKKAKRKGRAAGSQLPSKLITITLLSCIAFAAVLWHLNQKERPGSKVALSKNTEKVNAKTNESKTKTAEKLPTPRFEFYTLLPKMDVPVSTKEIREEQKPKQVAKVEKAPEKALEKTEEVTSQNKAVQQAVQDKNNLEQKKIEEELRNKYDTPVTQAQPSTTLVTEAPKKEVAPVKEQSKATSGQYVIQLAAFKSSNEADRLKAELLMMGFDVKIQAFSRGGSVWYKVRLGPFNSSIAAESARKELAQNGYKGIVQKVG